MAAAERVTIVLINTEEEEERNACRFIVFAKVEDVGRVLPWIVSSSSSSLAPIASFVSSMPVGLGWSGSNDDINFCIGWHDIRCTPVSLVDDVKEYVVLVVLVVVDDDDDDDGMTPYVCMAWMCDAVGYPPWL